MIWSKTYYGKLQDRIYSRGHRFDNITNNLKTQKKFPDIKNLNLGEGRKITAGVLFVDIVSFTERSAYATPEQLLLLLDIFLSEMTTIVNDWGGTVEKFTGDGLMAIFDMAQTTIDKMAKNIIDVATTMKYCIEGPINSFLHSRGIEPIKYRIGIDGGQIIIGRLGIRGDNDPVAIGWPANISAKLQERAEPNGTLLGNFIYKNLPEWEKEHCVAHVIPSSWTYIINGTVEKYPFYSYHGIWIIPPKL